MIISDYLTHLERLEKAAFKAPWKPRGRYVEALQEYNESEKFAAILHTTYECDAEFIAESREAVPKLIKIVKLLSKSIHEEGRIDPLDKELE